MERPRIIVPRTDVSPRRVMQTAFAWVLVGAPTEPASPPVRGFARKDSPK